MLGVFGRRSGAGLVAFAVALVLVVAMAGRVQAGGSDGTGSGSTANIELRSLGQAYDRILVQTAEPACKDLLVMVGATPAPTQASGAMMDFAISPSVLTYYSGLDFGALWEAYDMWMLVLTDVLSGYGVTFIPMTFLQVIGNLYYLSETGTACKWQTGMVSFEHMLNGPLPRRP